VILRCRQFPKQPWNSVDYSFDKDRFTFLVDNIRDSEYGRKLKQLSADINAAKGDYSVFEHIAYILLNSSNEDAKWNTFRILLECLIILDQIHDIHLSNRLCTTYSNYNNAAEGQGCYQLNKLITLLVDKAKSINIVIDTSSGLDTLKKFFIDHLKELPERTNILHELHPNESSSKIPNGIYVIRDTKSKGKAKEEVLIKTEEKIDTISSLTDSHSCKSNGNFKITTTIISINEIDILNLGLLYYQSYFSNLTYGGYRISIHFDTFQGSQEIACNGSFKLCITLWVLNGSKYKYLGTKDIEISSNVFSVKNICETLTKPNTVEKIAIELRAFFQQYDLDDDVIGIFLMNIFMIGKGYGDYGQGFTAGCAYMYKKGGIVHPLYCNCFVETVDTFFFLICVLCLFPAIIGTVGKNWQYVILNDSQRFLGQNVITMFNANSKIKVQGIDRIESYKECTYATLMFYDSDDIITKAFTEIESEGFFDYEKELSALEKSKENRKRSSLVSRPSETARPPKKPRHIQIKPSYIKNLEAVISGFESGFEELNLNAITSTLKNISIDDIINKGVKLAMAKFFTLRMIIFTKGEREREREEREKEERERERRQREKREREKEKRNFY